MRVIAMLSWFEESSGWLAATVASLKGLCEHVVACDGAYSLFPGARGWSGPEQHEAILETARAVGLGCTIHTPAGPWEGNEVEKRNRLLQLALLEAGPEDWLLRIDGDELVTSCPYDIHERLANADADVATVTLWQRNDLHAEPAIEEAARTFDYPMEMATIGVRFLFRALPSLRIEGTHATYFDGERRLAGPFVESQMELVEDLTDLRLEHRTAYRSRDRRRRAQQYYFVRDQHGIEETAPAV